MCQGTEFCTAGLQLCHNIRRLLQVRRRNSWPSTVSLAQTSQAKRNYVKIALHIMVAGRSHMLLCLGKAALVAVATQETEPSCHMLDNLWPTKHRR